MQFPELRLLGLLEGAEAVADNTQAAVLYEIERVVGTGPMPVLSVSVADCEAIYLGEGYWEQVMTSVLKAICYAFRDVLDILKQVVDLFITHISHHIETLIHRLTEWLEELVARISETIAGMLEGIMAQLERAVQAIVDTISGIVNAIVDQVNRMVEALEQAISSIIDKIEDIIGGILDGLEEGFRRLLDAAEYVVQRIWGGVQDVIAAVVEAVEWVYYRVSGAIEELIRTLTGAAEGALDRIRAVVEDIPRALRETVEGATEAVGDFIGTPLKTIGNLWVTQVEAFFEDLLDKLEVAPGKVVRDFLTSLGIPAELVEPIASGADASMPKTPAIFALAVAAIAPLLIIPVVSATLEPALEQLRQEANRVVRPSLIPLGELIEAHYRGEISEDALRSEFGQAGYGSERQDIIIRTGRRLLDVGEVFNWWLRELVSEEELDRQLAMQRIDPADVARLKEAVFYIPPVQDIITMAVREVFTPEIRARFGQDEGFPEVFAEWARRQGVSEEWARSYWAAHWALPSVTQGYEMLHRKVIEREDLELLLKAQDVMPFWRDKLVAISYAPLTRVDVRRMHKLGLLDEEGLQRRYEDVGYSPDDAALLVQFTLAYNAEAPVEDPSELAGLTRATVLGMLEDGILTEDQTRTMLVGLGYSEPAADLLVGQTLLELERKDRSEQISLVLEQAKSGAITFEQAEDRLSGIGLEPDELTRALTTLERDRQRQTSLPTRADLDRMITAGLIDESVYLDTLQRRGFTRYWSERYLELATQRAEEG